MKKVLFVCRENACRSQMAEAFARRYGWGRIKALSAGSAPSGTVHPKAIALMAELGCDLRSHVSKSIADLSADYFDYIVTMGCGDACPLVPAGKREDWDIPDPKEMDDEGFRRVRDVIETKVLALITRCG
jgi:arsenate reductase